MSIRNITPRAVTHSELTKELYEYSISNKYDIIYEALHAFHENKSRIAARVRNPGSAHNIYFHFPSYSGPDFVYAILIYNVDSARFTKIDYAANIINIEDIRRFDVDALI
jgi:hypothetical protein